MSFGQAESQQLFVAMEVQIYSDHDFEENYEFGPD